MHEGARFSYGPYFIAAGSPLHGAGFDVCLADFRLSPGALRCNQGFAVAPNERNPLAEQGYEFIDDANGNPIAVQMRSGLLVSPDPFELAADEEEFPHNPGDWDVEGFGNPRTYDHLWQFPKAYGRGNTDLGADELDLNLMIGYRTFTTTFVAATGQPGSPSNDFQWYLAASEGLVDPWTQGLPVVATTTPTFGPWHSDYLPLAGWSAGPSIPYYTPKYVDVVPHLMPDWHPWWTPQPHVYPTNIFWQPCQPYVSFINNSLWMVPSCGIINPVGTFTVTPNSLGFRWLDTDLLQYFAPTTNPAWPWMKEGLTPPASAFAQLVAHHQLGACDPRLVLPRRRRLCLLRPPVAEPEVPDRGQRHAHQRRVHAELPALVRHAQRHW